MAEDQVMKVEEEEEEFVMVGDGVEDEQAVSQQIAADDDQLDDEEDERHADDDRRIGAGEAVDDEKREARRVERKTRRQRQKEARDRDQRELRFLRQRNEQVERQLGDLSRRVSGQEKASIDGRIRQLDSAIASAEDVYAKAIDAGEGKDAAEAQRIRDQLRDQRNYLQQYKEQEMSEPVEDTGPDPALVENVKDWHSRNEWFDFGRRDEDSAIAGAVDDRMAAEGWDPTTTEYYDELDRRLAARLPHLYRGAGNSADDADGGEVNNRGSAKSSGGPKFRVGGRERALRSNEVHISRERREAMEQAGVWEDPVLRKKYLKRYADWDRENQNNA